MTTGFTSSHCRFECSGIATKPWTIRYSMVALERSLRSSKYCNIDDGLPPDNGLCNCSSCYCRLLVSWLTPVVHCRSGSSALNCFNAVNVAVSVRGPDWRSIGLLQLRSYEGLVCKCFDFHWTTSCVSMDKCTSGVCHFADRPIINRFVEVEIRIDDHAYKYFAHPGLASKWCYW